MTYSNSRDRFHRAARGALCFVAMALLAACSSSDKRPLLLVKVNGLGGLSNPQSATLTVTLSGQAGAATTQTIDVYAGSAGANANGSYGIYLPSGTSGQATVSVVVKDSSGCTIAQGTSTVSVSPGETSQVATITLSAAGPCTNDGGPGDALPPADVAAPLDNAGPDSKDGGPTSPSDTQSPDVVSTDTILDTHAAQEVNPDVPVAGEVNPDGPGVDVAMVVEVAPDGPVDTAPVVTTGSVFRNCTSYVHTELASDGTPLDYGVREVAFSPDGKHLVSFGGGRSGGDGRAKFWDVSAAGLVASPTGLVLGGDRDLTGGFSPDGKYLTFGDRTNVVTVYDFPATLDAGAGVTKWTLSPNAVLSAATRVGRIQFTSDLSHLIVLYETFDSSQSHYLAVWELAATPRIVRLVTYAYEEWPYAILPGDYAGSMWVATGATVTGDAGDYESTITLADVSLPSPVKVQATMAGQIESMIFTSDGNSLVVGRDTGEVSLWDIMGKTQIVRRAAPLIGGSTWDTDVYVLSFTPDGQYLAAGWAPSTAIPSVKLVTMALGQMLQRNLVNWPWSIEFAPSGLAVAVGESNQGMLLYCTP
jgi:WD40 repeat protein